MANDEHSEKERREANHQPIPGEHDHTTEAPTLPGIVGTTGYGVDLPETDADPTVDEETRKQIRWEGGGRIEAPRVRKTE